MTKRELVLEIARIDREATLSTNKNVLKSNLVAVCNKAFIEGMTKDEVLAIVNACRVTMEEQNRLRLVDADHPYDFSAVIG